MILRPAEGKKKSDVFVPDDTNIYRIGHKLAQNILNACKQAHTPTAVITFDYSGTPTKVTLLEKYIGQSGWLQVQHLSISSFENEDYLLLACFTDQARPLNPKQPKGCFRSMQPKKNPYTLAMKQRLWPQKPYSS
jgi:hypothetical protein